MRVTAIQMSPGHDKAANIEQATRLIDAAWNADRPDIVALPEVWSCLGGDREAKLDAAETLPEAGSDAGGGPAYAFLRDTARRLGVFVHGGSIGEHHGAANGAAEGARLFNTTLAFDPDGREVARYRKMHLFDITTPDGTQYGESRTYGAGDAVVTYEARGLRVGCAICYDVRFPELFLALRRAGAALVFLPSAFTVPTGRDHWEVLIRARAIETQCWLAAPATCGMHSDQKGEPRETYGHTLICDPWGNVVARVSDAPAEDGAGEGPASGTGWATADLDLALTERVRRDMPVLEHRRLA